MSSSDDSIIEDLKNQLKNADEKIIELVESLKQKEHLIGELEEALKKSTFLPASKVASTNNNESETNINNTKYRTLLQVKTIPVTVNEAGNYIIFSDPVARILEIRKASPRP